MPKALSYVLALAASIGSPPLRLKGRTPLLALGLASALLGGALGGCGSSPSPSAPAVGTVTRVATTQTSTASQMPASSGPTECTEVLTQHEAQIEFYSSTQDVLPLCQAFIQEAAKGGELWQEIAPPTLQAADASVVCQLVDSSAGVYAIVYDTGGQDYGQEACTSLLATGSWHEVKIIPAGAALPAPSTGTTTTGTTTAGS